LQISSREQEQKLFFDKNNLKSANRHKKFTKRPVLCEKSQKKPYLGPPNVPSWK
jgi:hypothetical protein